MFVPPALAEDLNLELERKHAKQLLRALNAGDASALARVSVLPRARQRRRDWKLSDAQLILAREHGFTSWPRLVAYLETWQRHAASGPAWEDYGVEFYEHRVRDLVARHAARRPEAAHALGSFVPRLIGLTETEILDTPVEEVEVRHTVARLHRHASWDALRRTIPVARLGTTEERRATPFGEACAHLEAGNLPALQALLVRHPDMLHPEYRAIGEANLLNTAWYWQRVSPGPTRNAIVEWLESSGLMTQEFLNRQLNLIGRGASRRDVDFLLEKGADPKWVPRNGITLLERALMVCWDPEPVDLILGRVNARDAFWVHAGTGDVDAMNGFLTSPGELAPAAGRARPDFLAVGLQIPSRPEAPAAELLWEALLIAALNCRGPVIDRLLSHGVDLDQAPWGTPLLNLMVGNRLDRHVEVLVARGADPNRKGFMPTMTARELAADALKDNPEDQAVQRIAELVGA